MHAEGSLKMSVTNPSLCLSSRFPTRYGRDLRSFLPALPAAQVFFPGRPAAADVPLPLVALQNLLRPRRELGINLLQALRDVLVNRRLAHAEFPGAGAHRRAGLQYMLRRLHHAQMHLFPHALISPRSLQAMPGRRCACPC